MPFALPDVVGGGPELTWQLVPGTWSIHGVTKLGLGAGEEGGPPLRSLLHVGTHDTMLLTSIWKTWRLQVYAFVQGFYKHLSSACSLQSVALGAGGRS